MKKLLTHLVLTGLPASGKTTLAINLASHLKCFHLDLDQYLTQKFGLTIDEIISQNSWEYFREQEFLALQEIFDQAREPFILSLGGGSLNEQSYKLIKKNHSIIFFLNTPLNIISERLLHQTHRPMFKNLTKTMIVQKLKNLNDQRKPLYEKSDYFINEDQINHPIEFILSKLKENIK